MARTSPRPPRRSTPPFAELLTEAVRLRDAGIDYEVEVTPEYAPEGPERYRPERVHVFPRRPAISP